MSLTFYFHPISQPSRAILALLAIGNIKYEQKVLDIFKGEARTPEFLEINPFGGIPFIIHDKLHLAESNAILIHLVQAFPNQLKGYYGANSEERDHINQYLSWYQGTYRPTLIKPLRLQFEGLRKSKPVSKTAVAEAVEQIKQTIGLLQKQLSKGHPYLVGDHLSIADLLIYNESTDLQVSKIDFSQFPHFTAWYNRIIANPAVAPIHAKFLEGLPAFTQRFVNLEYTE